MDNNRFLELDEAIDDCLTEFGDKFYYDKDGNAVKKKAGLLKKVAIGGAAAVGALSIGGGIAQVATKRGRSAMRGAYRAGKVQSGQLRNGMANRMAKQSQVRGAGQSVRPVKTATGYGYQSFSGAEETHEFILKGRYYTDKDGNKQKRPLVGPVGAVAAGGLAYGAARRSDKFGTAIKRGEVNAENAVRGAMGRTKDAARKGLKTAADLPGKAQDAAGNLARNTRNKVSRHVKMPDSRLPSRYAPPATGTARAISAVKRGGSDLLKKSKGLKNTLIAGTRKMRFESEEEFEAYVDRCVELESQFLELTEFDKSTALFRNLPDDWERSGHTEVRNDKRGGAVVKGTSYKKPRRISKADAFKQKAHKDGQGVTIYEDRSPSRVRRSKAIGTAAVTGGLGYAAGKYGKALLKKASAMRRV